MYLFLLTGLMVHTIWMGAVESHSNRHGNLWFRASPHILASCPRWHQGDCFCHSGKHHSAPCFASHWLQGKSHLRLPCKTDSWSNHNYKQQLLTCFLLGLLHIQFICSCLSEQLYFFETALETNPPISPTPAHAITNTSMGKMNWVKDWVDEDWGYGMGILI